MKCITFSFYKSYYYFIVYWITSIIFSFLTSLFLEQKNDLQEYNRNIEVTIQFIYLISKFGGDLLAGFLVLYSYITTRKLTINEKEINNINKNNNISSKKINRCTLILIVSTIEFACKIIHPIFTLYFKSLEIGEIMYLISITDLSRIFFSHYVLKIILYKHHMISLLIYLIGYFFKSILAFIAGDIHLKRWPYLLFLIIEYILEGLEDVLNKKLLTEKYMLPHVLMFLRGLYNSGMAIVSAIIFKISGFEFTFSSNINIFFLFSFLIFFNFFQNFFIMKVNYVFTPQHLSFLGVVYFMFLFLIYRISNNYSVIIIICESIINLFLIFSTLLFSEMVIINKWGLNNNTKKQSLIKEQQEFYDENSISELIDEKKENEYLNKD